MNNKTVSNLGFIGISLLLFTIVFGGLLIENYDVKSFKRIIKSKKNFNLFFAYYIKNIRLIDNI